ncbi:hypothetical protein EVAR_100151_1 [Eumeta japonica]|uniref:Uncharacterized protein n=1 Tax=Eumeta variegata TaxID=151549 RepID=A0A4C1ZRP4_EUMVA|nr:hypothetical protein EVAR_100151_1 [Eumeta japonica]
MCEKIPFTFVFQYSYPDRTGEIVSESPHFSYHHTRAPQQIGEGRPGLFRCVEDLDGRSTLPPKTQFSVRVKGDQSTDRTVSEPTRANRRQPAPASFAPTLSQRRYIYPPRFLATRLGVIDSAYTICYLTRARAVANYMSPIKFRNALSPRISAAE